LLWSSVWRIMVERNRLFVFGTLPSGLYGIPELITSQILAEKRKKRRVYILGKVGTDALVPILFSFLLGLFEDEFRYVAVEVIICNCARERCTHLGTDKAGNYRRERTVSHPWCV
jgi:hypothetical protein